MTKPSSFEELQLACRATLGVELDSALEWDPISRNIDLTDPDWFRLHELALWKTHQIDMDPRVEAAAHQLLGAGVLHALAHRQDSQWDNPLLATARAWSGWGSRAINSVSAQTMALHIRGMMEHWKPANKDHLLPIQLAYLFPQVWQLSQDAFRAKLSGVSGQRQGVTGKPPGGSLPPEERDLLYRHCYDEFSWNSVDELLRFATLGCSARIPKGNLPHLLGVLVGPHNRPFCWAMGLDKRLGEESTISLARHGPALMERLAALPWDPENADCWGLWCIVDTESYRWKDLGIAHERVLAAHPTMQDAVERVWSLAAALHDGHERSRAAHQAYRETSTLSYPLPNLDEGLRLN